MSWSTAVAYLLTTLNIRNLCLVYFAASPFFLDQGGRVSMSIVFGAGYVMAIPILFLALSERLVNLDRYGRREIPMRWIIFGLVAICVLSVVINSPEMLLMWSPIFTKYLKLLIPAGVALVMVQALGVSDLSRLYKYALIVASLGILFQVVQPLFMTTAENRYSSFFHDPNWYSLFLVAVYGLTITRGCAALEAGGRWLPYFATAPIVLFAVYLSGSRSGLLAFTCVTLFAFWNLGSKRIRKILFLVSVAAVVFVFAILSIHRYGAGQAVQSDMGRLWSYMVGWNIIQDRPMTGVGFGNVLLSYDTYGGLFTILLGGPLEIHNSFLEVFAETGVFGGIAYLALLLVPMVVLMKRVSKYRKSGDSKGYYPFLYVGAICILLTYFICGSFLPNHLGHDNFWAFYGYVLLCIRLGTEYNLESGGQVRLA